MDTILFGERVAHEKGKKFGWNTLYDGRKNPPKIMPDSLLGKKSIICFPGDGSRTEAGANGLCGIVERMLTLAGVSQDEMPHLYGLAYCGKEISRHREKVLQDLDQLKLLDHISDQEDTHYYQPLFDEYILPLIVDKKGRPYSPEKIKENVQNITFVTHCHGGFLAYQIEKMIAEKIAEFYPEKQKELMDNIRMIHFSSRRPITQTTFGKHLDVISKNDMLYADPLLEYDDIHEQIQRVPLEKPLALVPISATESTLVLKQATTEDPDEIFASNKKQDVPDEHTGILKVFSGEVPNPFPENESALRCVRHLLRHFVEHPEDVRDLEPILMAIDPEFTAKNLAYGRLFLSQEQENGKIRRGLISLLADPQFQFGGSAQRRYDKMGRRKDSFDEYEFLRQHGDDGEFLFNSLKKRYLKTGDRRELMQYIELFRGARIPAQAKEELILTAVRKKDWPLVNAFSKVSSDTELMMQVLATIQPINLHHILPFLKRNISSSYPESFVALLRKSSLIKNVQHKQQMERLLKQRCSVWSLPSLLKKCSSREKRILKAFYAAERKQRAERLWRIKKERDTHAKGFSVRDLLKFYDSTEGLNVNIDDFKRFMEQKRVSPRLNLWDFLHQKRGKNLHEK